MVAQQQNIEAVMIAAMKLAKQPTPEAAVLRISPPYYITFSVVSLLGVDELDLLSGVDELDLLSGVDS